jgi:uroporphyrin-III C-methyltransferase/precorrin-2 dehydrogenase/sirohydrochlorin ferrochelatase
MTLPALPIFVRLAGRPVILIGEGETGEAKRRLLERAGAVIVDERAEAALALVALPDPDTAVARLRKRGILVNAADRPDLCDFMLPAIIDRDPVIVAIGTGGASAGLAAALRQRLETLLPEDLGRLARDLDSHKVALRTRWPDPAERRRVIAEMLADPDPIDIGEWIARGSDATASALLRFTLASTDPDDLTLRQARALAQADRVFHLAAVPLAILDRARADAPRIPCKAPPANPGPGLSLYLEMAR